MREWSRSLKEHSSNLVLNIHKIGRLVIRIVEVKATKVGISSLLVRTMGQAQGLFCPLYEFVLRCIFQNRTRTFHCLRPNFLKSQLDERQFGRQSQLFRHPSASQVLDFEQIVLLQWLYPLCHMDINNGCCKKSHYSTQGWQAGDWMLTAERHCAIANHEGKDDLAVICS